jgi:aryl-alcohol dehydrogenase-like predicted oxidoreductase
LPLAREKRLAVLVNRPLTAGALFNKVRGKSLPPWSKEIGCASWAQFFLKFVISHAAVTCAIPATAKVEHLVDNMQAMHGPLPDASGRDRMARYLSEI